MPGLFACPVCCFAGLDCWYEDKTGMNGLAFLFFWKGEGHEHHDEHGCCGCFFLLGGGSGGPFSFCFLVPFSRNSNPLDNRISYEQPTG